MRRVTVNRAVHAVARFFGCGDWRGYWRGRGDRQGFTEGWADFLEEGAKLFDDVYLPGMAFEFAGYFDECSTLLIS